MDEKEWHVEFERLKHLRQLTVNLQAVLPAAVSSHASVTNIGRGTVTVTVNAKEHVGPVRRLEAVIIQLVRDYGIHSAQRLQVMVGRSAFHRTHKVSLGALISQGEGVVGQIQRKAQRLAAFNQAMAQSLGHPFPSHAYVANVRDGVVTLCVDSGAQASNIRYLSQQILTLCREMGASNATEVQVRVVPLQVEQERVVKPATSMSRDNALIIKQVGESMPGELGRALKKLSTRLRKKPIK